MEAASPLARSPTSDDEDTRATSVVCAEQTTMEDRELALEEMATKLSDLRTPLCSDPKTASTHPRDDEHACYENAPNVYSLKTSLFSDPKTFGAPLPDRELPTEFLQNATKLSGLETQQEPDHVELEEELAAEPVDERLSATTSESIFMSHIATAGTAPGHAETALTAQYRDFDKTISPHPGDVNGIQSPDKTPIGIELDLPSTYRPSK